MQTTNKNKNNQTKTKLSPQVPQWSRHSVARVRRRGDRPPSRKKNHRNILFLTNRGRDKEFLSLYVKIWTGSRHLVFWLLGTLTGLRDGVRRLVA